MLDDERSSLFDTVVGNIVFATNMAIAKTKCAFYDVVDAISFVYPPKAKPNYNDTEETAEEAAEEIYY